MRPLRLLQTLICLASIHLLAGCGLFDHQSVTVENVTDSASFTSEDSITVTVTLDVDYPQDGDPLMVRSVKQWLGSALSLTDTTAMAGAEQFAEAFFLRNNPGKEMVKDHPQGYRYSLTISKTDETSSYITFVITTRTLDGEQLTATHTGATFIKPTGKIFGMEMFDAEKERTVAQLVRDGLMQRFGADDFSQLLRYLPDSCFNSDDQGVRRFPQAAPWIEGQEVIFQYAADELPNDSIPMPQARISLNTARNVFSQDFIRALKEYER